jgi:hypothetical protein
MNLRLTSILAVLASTLFLAACQGEGGDEESGGAEESSGESEDG